MEKNVVSLPDFPDMLMIVGFVFICIAFPIIAIVAVASLTIVWSREKSHEAMMGKKLHKWFHKEGFI